MVRDSNVVKYQEYVKPPVKVGDIAYWDGNSVKTVPLSNWNTGLGTPVGVVMIGENFLPDSKVRIISLTSMNDGELLQWNEPGESVNNSSVLKFKKVPTTDNASSANTDNSDYGGYLPSDIFTWKQSYVDPLTKYFVLTPMIPSPYLGDKFNPTYATELSDGNALSDFNGLTNTQLLVNEGEQYHAAHACWNYKDSASSNLQWYLPTIGELGLLMVRFQLINTSIQTVGGTPIGMEDILWSSTMYSKEQAYYLHIETGNVWGEVYTEGKFPVRSCSCL